MLASVIKKDVEVFEKEIKLIRKELRWLTSFHYPKLVMFAIIIIAAYFIFSNPNVENFVSSLGGWGYLGVFIGGMLFTSGFTTPFAIGFFVTLNPQSIWIIGILGGFGALLGDLIIFKFIKYSFMDEFKRLEKTTIIRETSNLIDKTIGHKIKIYLMYVFAGVLFASPLPDEVAILILAGLTKIKPSIFAIISFVTNTIGILIFLSL